MTIVTERRAVVDTWMQQLTDPDTRALVDLAVKQGRAVQLVLYVDAHGKIGRVKITGS